MHIALTIAGSDSGGGAGIQADLKVFQRFGVFGTTVITAVTAQNTHGVRSWMAVPPEMVEQQLDAVVPDLRPAALKSGMLANAALASLIARLIRMHSLAPYVLDPVMVATSGDALLDGDAIDVVRRELLPLATLVTPNLSEAAMLTGTMVASVEDMERAARALVELGAGAALVTGGHLAGDSVVDVLHDAGGVQRFTHPRLHSRSTHGSGCTLAAAITAQLAVEVSLGDAVQHAVAYVHRAIATAPGLGEGNGPLNFMA